MSGTGSADPDREPHRHLRWSLERVEPGEEVDGGGERVVRGADGGERRA